MNSSKISGRGDSSKMTAEECAKVVAQSSSSSTSASTSASSGARVVPVAKGLCKEAVARMKNICSLVDLRELVESTERMTRTNGIFQAAAAHNCLRFCRQRPSSADIEFICDCAHSWLEAADPGRDARGAAQMLY